MRPKKIITMVLVTPFVLLTSLTHIPDAIAKGGVKAVCSLQNDYLQSVLYRDVSKWYSIRQGRTSEQSPVVHDVQVSGYQQSGDHIQILGRFKANDEMKVVHIVTERNANGCLDKNWGGGFSPDQQTRVQPCGTLGRKQNNEYLWFGGGLVNVETITNIRITLQRGHRSFVVPVKNHCYFFVTRTQITTDRQSASPGFTIQGLDSSGKEVYNSTRI